MNLKKQALRLASVAGVAALALGAAVSTDSSFQVLPGHPSAKAPVKFADRSAGATSWLWTFGDGLTSTERNPTHVYQGAGVYPVTLRATGPSGMMETTSVVTVADDDTLVLLAADGHAFQVSLHATDPRTGNQGDGHAVPQNDVFGYFTVPTLVPQAPGAPLVPEVFVKMLDARAIGQDFWLFWGGLTDLTYTLTVTDTVRGTQKQYNNPVTGNPICLGADTSGFAAAGANPTPTPPPASVHSVMVGQNGNAFTDAQSGTHQTTIRVGDTVQWSFMTGPHTTTSGTCSGGGGGGYYGAASCDDNGIWTSGSESAGSKFSQTFTHAGTYPYFCQVHGSAMTGTIVVNPE